MSDQLELIRDPLAKFNNGGRVRGTGIPVPLTATAIDARVLGGLAIVRTERTFRNAEAKSIEATITFPVPVHATMVALTASVDGRNLLGRAQRKQQARATYEAAIDSGKTAVLHEEALRGVHILSVGHIPPGKDIKVTSVWAMPLSRHGTVSIVRIPVTVGDIYGRSPLPDSDNLVHAPGQQLATLSVISDSGTVSVRDTALVNGSAEVVLNGPIDILVENWSPRTLYGVAADGRRVALDIRPYADGEMPLDAELLLDNSGSMDEPAAGRHSSSSIRSTKHDVMVRGLRKALHGVHRGDRVGLWGFGNDCHRIGSVDELPHPHGGTQIGRALTAVSAKSESAEIVILTDGKSHDIDVQALARTGRRFTAILVGDDSLDAHVGYLAALTGGQLFVVPGTEADTAILTAINSMRTGYDVALPIDGPPRVVQTRIGGMDIRACWEEVADGATVVGINVPGMIEGPEGRSVAVAGTSVVATSPSDSGQHPVIDSDDSRHIGAVAAALAIPRMREEDAAALAEAHGIVCHLTSLVLVDEAAEVQDGIPAQRKVPLMTPATQTKGLFDTSVYASAASAGGEIMRSMSFAPSGVASKGLLGGGARGMLSADPWEMSGGGWQDAERGGGAYTPTELGGGSNLSASVFKKLAKPAKPKTVKPDLSGFTGLVDWSAAEALRQGDFSSLPTSVAAAILKASVTAEVAALAADLGIRAAVVAVALLAGASADKDRNAARLFRAVLGKADTAKVEAARASVSL